MHHSSMSWEITIYKRSLSKCKISEKFRLLRWISPNLYFDRLLLLKVYTISAKKKYRGVMPHDTEDWCKIWTKTNLLFQNWQEFGEFWSEHDKVSKICTLIAPFRAKYIIFDLKKYRRVIFHDTEKSCKSLRKTCLWFGKWHEDFDKFSPEHLKLPKICTSVSCFWPKYKMFELKKYRGVMLDGSEY